MLNGITVLNTEILNNSWGLSDGLLIGLLLIVGTGFVFKGLFSIIEDCTSASKDVKDTLSLVFTLLVIFISMSIPFFLVDAFQFEDYKEYKVTIDDSVTFNDFADKYKIHSHEGKIYTIVELGTDNIKKK